MVLGWAKTSKSYDQFEQYSKLPTLLKRFSFQEKMRIANHYSSRAIRFNINKTQEPESPMMLPWCVETFVMLSMEATEYAEGDFRGRNEEKAKKMLNAIWDSTAEVLQKQYGNFSLLDVLLPMSALSQFPAQEHLWIKAYRYWTVFNNNAEPLCLRDVFAQKMGTSYEEFLMLGYFLQLMFLAQAEGKNGTIPVKVLEYLLRVRYPKAAKKLVTTRERYVELQRLFIKSNPDSLMYTYSLRPSLQYPLVEEKGVIYFPLPHLFLQSVTSALMFRVTEGNDKMRTKIGAIWEQYVLRLMQDLRDFGVYDEAVGEQPYLHCGSTAYSPDVLVRQGNEMLFLEVKSTVPSVDIRIMQPKAHEENINRIAGYMVQLYNQMKRIGKYNPFVGRVSDNMSDHWGIVIVQEDSYIRRRFYYDKAREKLNLQAESNEWCWFLNHIKVAGLYEVERVSLGGKSLIDACKEVFLDNPYGYAFMGYPNCGGKLVNNHYLQFKEMWDEKVHNLIEEMMESGCFDT